MNTMFKCFECGRELILELNQREYFNVITDEKLYELLCNLFCTVCGWRSRSRKYICRSNGGNIMNELYNHEQKNFTEKNRNVNSWSYEKDY